MERKQEELYQDGGVIKCVVCGVLRGVSLQSQGAVAKALEEDPEVFDYDGQYDKIQEQKRKTNTRLAQRDKSVRCFMWLHDH